MTEPVIPPSADQTPPLDTRPMVARRVNDRGLLVFGGALALAGVALFSVLEGRRTQVVSSPATGIGDAGGDIIAAPPELTVPNPEISYGYPYADRPRISSLPGMDIRAAAPQIVRAGEFRPRTIQPIILPGQPAPQIPAPYVESTYSEPAVRPAAPEATATAQKRPEPRSSESRQAGQSLAGSRNYATRLANPSTTVPQGAVIQAVLETAIDSNRPGFARAIVSRDVRGFDGSRVLIPRGTRLFGEYKTDVASGQNRALVNWLSLTRPDGVQIALDSPAADPLGRAGVKGKVNSHFFARFGSALLQSVLDIGVNVASDRVADRTLIVGLPGSTQALREVVRPEQVTPTLTVRQGSGVSVFVAGDLDFSTADQ